MVFIARIAALLVVAGLSVPAVAQATDGAGEKNWTLTAGAFMPLDDELCGADTETGFSLALSRLISLSPVK
ncbi:MAG: hypothetical protein FJX72_13620 [Armatimonadetes bacterium]|nr:hypothetical protein [Armatimonadota bacterium]